MAEMWYDGGREEALSVDSRAALSLDWVGLAELAMATVAKVEKQVGSNRASPSQKQKGNKKGTCQAKMHQSAAVEKKKGPKS